jgi:hypothetical protein
VEDQVVVGQVVVVAGVEEEPELGVADSVHPGPGGGRRAGFDF